jgi:hypothetical protein
MLALGAPVPRSETSNVNVPQYDPRQFPPTLQGILKWSTAVSAAEAEQSQSSSSGQHQPRSQEDIDFLKRALQGMTEDVVKKIQVIYKLTCHQ